MRFRYRPSNGPRRAFTLIELMIVVGIIIILASFGIPQYVGYRENAQRAKCISNLRTILMAKIAYRANRPKLTATADLANLQAKGYIRGPYRNATDLLKCPNGGSYNLNWTDPSIPYLKPSCSYSGTIRHVLGKESNQ